MSDPMQHGRFARPRRHGDTIERAISPAAGNVHALLAYHADPSI
ncbi:hypothetical protein [Actinoplanes sp. ATCC 53533]|nr:hypothetical protein [Actinoplanes sp. ATCC 53533]